MFLEHKAERRALGRASDGMAMAYVSEKLACRVRYVFSYQKSRSRFGVLDNRIVA